MKKLEEMSESEIVVAAIERGYTVRDTPTGKRIGGSAVTNGADEWMNTVNVRLWKVNIPYSEWPTDTPIV